MSAESEPTEPTDPLQFLSHVRGKLKRHLEVNDNEEQLRCDLSHIIREIRALITVNDEIFNAIISRCIIFENYVDDKVVARRLGFKKINTRQASNMIELYAYIEFDDRDFDIWPLTNLPSCLEDTISVNYNENNIRIDFIVYKDYFQKVLMMVSDDALEFILPKLKDHLETAQVCLGNIHEWVIHPTNDLSFMNLDFHDLIKIPADTPSLACYCCGKLSNRCTETKCGKRIVLKSFETNHSFDLSLEGERERLVKHIGSFEG